MLKARQSRTGLSHPSCVEQKRVLAVCHTLGQAGDITGAADLPFFGYNRLCREQVFKRYSVHVL